MTPEWIAIDATTDGLRGWAMNGADVLAGARAAGAFAPALAAVLAELPAAEAAPIIATGVDIPPRMVPCAPLPQVLARHGTLRAIPPLAQADPPALSHGAEARIAGFLATQPDFDGVVCVIARQTIWAHISAGEVVSFQSLLGGALADAVGGRGGAHDGDAFGDALADILSRPEKFAARLASVQAARQLGQIGADAAQSRINAVLIGAELAAMRPYWLGQQVAIIGSGAWAQRYADALAAQGAAPQRHDADDMALAGLIAAHALA